MKPLDAIEFLSSIPLASHFTVALPESEDSRVQAAAQTLLQAGGSVWLWKNSQKKKRQEHPRLTWVSSDLYEEPVYQTLQTRLPPGKYAEADLRQKARSPLYQACWLLAQGKVDTALAGAVTPTADVIRAGLMLLGLAEGVKTVSGAFFLEKGSEQYVFSDCGVVITPTESQLVDIAAAAAHFYQRITGKNPQVAFLSFSTHGSAQHPLAENTRRAAQVFHERYPHISSDGELQVDAALDLTIRQRKAPHSPLVDTANVLVFPNLEAGNIAYKLMQRLGGFSAYGPILQGFARPLSDLSRGASAQDIVAAAYLTALSLK